MSPQIADDAAREMKRPWLGPSGSWRWPFDATFTQWGAGAACTLAAVVPLWRIVPVGLLLLAGGWWLGARLGPLVAPERARAAQGVLTGAAWLLAALVAPSWPLWASPMPLLAAVPVAAVLAILLVRRFGSVLDHNRPPAYWLALPWRVASGPRPGEPLEIHIEEAP